MKPIENFLVRRAAIRERAHHPGAMTNLLHHPFQHVICPDLTMMLPREAIVGPRLGYGRSASCSVLAYISNCERKDAPQTLYLTVEQVRVAACAWVEAHAYPPSARTVAYEQAVAYILYYQQRNRQARLSHWKTTIHKLKNAWDRCSKTEVLYTG